MLPEVLRELYLGRRTGLLHIARGEERVSFRFVNGEVVSGSSTSKTGRLGETMVRHGLLALEDLVRALVVVHSTKRRLGPVLREMGVIDEPRMEQALALHIRDMLLTALVWDDASHLFEEQELPEGPTEDLTLRSSTGELILEVVRSISSRETVRTGLGDIDRVLLAVPNPPFRLERITLNPADGYVLSRVDGAATARDIMAITPLPVEDVERSLLGLLCTGVVEYRPGPAPSPRPVVEKKVSEKVPPRVAPDPERLAELRRAVTHALDGVSKKDHFEVLGVKRTASAEQVKDAFVHLVKVFHPDKHVELDSELKSKVHTVFAGIHEAYRVLGSAEKRKRYEASLRDDPRPAPRPSPPFSPAPTPTPAATTEPGRTIERAHDGLATRNHFQVLGLLRTASLADVQNAHVRLCKTFHPDAHRDLPPDLKAKVKAVFTRIGEAYEVLSSTEKRAQYEQLLKEAARSAPNPTSLSSPAAAPAKSDPNPAAPADTPSVLEALTAAEGHLAEGRYAEAVPLLESIAPLARGTLERRVRLLLGRGYLMKPEWARKAEGEFLKLIRLDPQDAEAHCALGKFYRDRSFPERARVMFQRALELQPGHRTARAELAVLQPSKPDSQTLIGKILRKSR